MRLDQSLALEDGDDPPGQWMPPNRAFWCQYAVQFVAVLRGYALPIDAASAVTLRDAGSDGIAYDSVRHAGGECVAAFHPDVLSPARQGEHLYYHWDGARIAHVVVAGEVIALPRAAKT